VLHGVRQGFLHDTVGCDLDGSRQRWEVLGCLNGDTQSCVLVVHHLCTHGSDQAKIVERRRAQDGQISVNVDGRELDVRVATIETIWGEKLVMRLLDRSRSLITLPQLGFSRGAYEEYHRMLHSPYGMMIVSGPTGSGKTTSLYASIHELDQQVPRRLVLNTFGDYP